MVTGEVAKSATGDYLMMGVCTGYIFQPSVCRLTNYSDGPEYLPFSFQLSTQFGLIVNEVGAYTPYVGLGNLADQALNLS